MPHCKIAVTWPRNGEIRAGQSGTGMPFRRRTKSSTVSRQIQLQREDDMRCIALGVSIGLVCGAIAVSSAPLPAQANCYELIGCTNKDYFKPSDLQQLGCQPLWEVRNWIYKENGYCFHTQKAIEAFGNAGCQYDDVAEVPLNDIERSNVSAIKTAEANKGC
jgi:hypothetical protein